MDGQKIKQQISRFSEMSKQHLTSESSRMTYNHKFNVTLRNLAIQGGFNFVLFRMINVEPTLQY